MAATAAATVAATVVLLYLVVIWQPAAVREGERTGDSGGGKDGLIVLDREKGSGSSSSSSKRRRRRRKSFVRPIQPPANWKESVLLVANTLRFVYSETFAKWPFADLIFGIRYHMRRQGNLEVASVFAGSNSVELKGREILDELIRLQRLLQLCFLFSKNQYQMFLELADYSEEDVIVKGTKAAFLKPAFTILRDRNSKSFLLLIRGALSMKDKLTAATGPDVPFHHLVLNDGNINNLVIGYAHCGMVAAARWIAKSAIPSLRKAVKEDPDYRIEIVGHSMGAGIAALLTYMLRECEEFSSCTCVAFGPAACMTWDLAESGKDFVTSVVNATDLVPTFSAVSVRNLRSEISASSWLTSQIQQTKFLGGACHLLTSVKSHLPSISIGRSSAKGTGKFAQPTSSSTQVGFKHAQNASEVAVTGCSLSSCSCMISRRRAFGTRTSPDEDVPDTMAASENSVVTDLSSSKPVEKLVNGLRTSDTNELYEGGKRVHVNGILKVTSVEDMNEGEYWIELEKELNKLDKDIQGIENEALEELDKEKGQKQAGESKQTQSSDSDELQQLYPPGRIMHMVAVPALDIEVANLGEDPVGNRSIGIYETPRHMYGNIRLSQTMIANHYMPRYKKMMNLLIDKLSKEDGGCT